MSALGKLVKINVHSPAGISGERFAMTGQIQKKRKRRGRELEKFIEVFAPSG